jgi:hypothetical protein
VKRKYFDLPEAIALAQLSEKIVKDFASAVKFFRGEEELAQTIS